MFKSIEYTKIIDMPKMINNKEKKQWIKLELHKNISSKILKILY